MWTKTAQLRVMLNYDFDVRTKSVHSRSDYRHFAKWLFLPSDYFCQVTTTFLHLKEYRIISWLCSSEFITEAPLQYAYFTGSWYLLELTYSILACQRVTALIKKLKFSYYYTNDYTIMTSIHLTIVLWIPSNVEEWFLEEE